MDSCSLKGNWIRWNWEIERMLHVCVPTKSFLDSLHKRMGLWYHWLLCHHVINLQLGLWQSGLSHASNHSRVHWRCNWLNFMWLAWRQVRIVINLVSTEIEYLYNSVCIHFLNSHRFGRKPVFFGCCFLAGLTNILRLFLPGHFILFLIITFVISAVISINLVILASIVAELAAPGKKCAQPILGFSKVTKFYSRRNSFMDLRNHVRILVSHFQMASSIKEI